MKLKKIISPLIYSFSALSLFFFGSLLFSSPVYADTQSLTLQNLVSPFYNVYTPLDYTLSQRVGPNPPIADITNWDAFNPSDSSTYYGLNSFGGIFRKTGQDLSFTFNVEFYLYATAWQGGSTFINLTDPVVHDACSDLRVLVGLYNGNSWTGAADDSSVITTCEFAFSSNFNTPHLHVVASIFQRYESLYSFDSIHFQVYNDNKIIRCGGSSLQSCGVQTWWGLSSLTFSYETTSDSTVIIMQQQLQIQREEQAHRQELEEQAGSSLESGNSDAQSGSEQATAFTTNYLNVLIRFRDMLLNVHATDCNIAFPQTGNMTPQGGRFNLGTINFCALSVPTPIMSISSIAIFWLMIKLSIWVVRQFYETFEEMIDGGGGK